MNPHLAAIYADRPDWANNLILAGLRGSDAHGTKLPADHPRATDDTDTFAISVQPVEWYLGLRGCTKSRLHWDPEVADSSYDHLIYDVRKLFALLLKGNPNVHCWLWTEPEDIILADDRGRMILANREMFLSQACFDALGGYAQAQMLKMDRSTYAGYMGKKRKAIVDELGEEVGRRHLVVDDGAVFVFPGEGRRLVVPEGI